VSEVEVSLSTVIELKVASDVARQHLLQVGGAILASVKI
jgi:hypothetical protein